MFAATELPTSATVDADSETLSELHHSLYETESMHGPVITYYGN